MSLRKNYLLEEGFYNGDQFDRVDRFGDLHLKSCLQGAQAIPGTAVSDQRHGRQISRRGPDVRAQLVHDLIAALVAEIADRAAEAPAED